MSGILHAIEITTLAAWVSLAGVCTIVPTIDFSHSSPTPTVEVKVPPIVINEIIMDAPAPDGAEATSASAPAATPSVDSWSAPPALAEPSQSAVLPEVPSLPVQATALERIAQPATRPRSAKPSAVVSGSVNAAAAARPGVAGGQGGGDAAARLVGGRMPAPRYPEAARRGGQTGTVLVEFTIDAAGRVVSAIAKQPSPWPLLNEEAVNTVRRWKFPPGGVMKLQRPIVFELR
jgi:protein TonB